MEDAAGNTYFDVANIRITALRETWDNKKPGIRVQAYKDKDVGDALFQGAEIPVRDKATADELLKAITKALESVGV